MVTPVGEDNQKRAELILSASAILAKLDSGSTKEGTEEKENVSWIVIPRMGGEKGSPSCTCKKCQNEEEDAGRTPRPAKVRFSFSS